jgi:hypothetical protein
MYTCPDSTVFLLYCDGELSSDLRTVFEAHLQTCEVCTKRLHGLKSIRHVFNQDAAQIGLGDADLNVSYQRLQARLRYHDIIKNAGKQVFPSGFRWAVPALAAIFILAFLIPLGHLFSRGDTSAGFAGLMMTSPQRQSQKWYNHEGIIINGPIDENTLPYLLADVRENPVNRTYLGEQRLYLPELDVFKPDFPASGTPGMNFSISPLLNSVMNLHIQNIPADFYPPAGIFTETGSNR